MSVSVNGRGNGMVLESMESMRIADQLVRKVFRTINGNPNLVVLPSGSWRYERDRWTPLSDDQFLDVMVNQLRDAYMLKVDKEGVEVMDRFAETKKGSFVGRCREVKRCVEALVRRSEDTVVPCWLGEEPQGFPAGKCIAFRDKVVCVAKGGLKVMERDERWFSPGFVDVMWDPEAKCPLWDRCLGEWMPGDPGGQSLYQRWFGYCMMGDRTYARTLLHLGKTRSGKGTSTNVAKALIGGYRYHARTLEDLTTPWAFEGMERGGVMVINELSELNRNEGQRVAKILKNCNGEDTVDINVKYGAKVKGVRLQIAPWICGNEFPQLSNRGQGLAGKILPLKFNVSFLGKEDHRLEEKLLEESELQGIAVWAVQGARELEASEPQERWPECEGAKEVMEDFLMEGNLIEMFLRDQFVENGKGKVSNAQIRGLWLQWCKMERVSSPYADLHVPRKLVDEGSWDLRAYKSGGARGVRGLSLRKGAKRGVVVD